MATPDMLAAADTTIDWKISKEPVDYADALQQMEERAAQIANGEANDLIWLLEHPPLYTAGTSAKEEDMLTAQFPVHKAGRGGQFTYHGPGQRVAYLMLDLKLRRQDIRWYIHELEQWIIDALATFQVVGERREGRVGIWVDRSRYGGRQGQEDKIAAIGVRVRRWVTMHGISINVDPDLSHFDGIVPCGIREHGVTSLVDLGLPVTLADMDVALRDTLPEGLANRHDAA
ncbi:MAG: lipoyl(octanoyl) transferase LipB [Alphaproteobacteria bacterium]|nr:lipoyl(octanoyl) transferase LipB [Alphaproteobacteria bacterium SS10]